MKLTLFCLTALVLSFGLVPTAPAGELALVGYQVHCDGRGHCWQEAVYAEAATVQAAAARPLSSSGNPYDDNPHWPWVAAQATPMPIGNGPVTVYAGPPEQAFHLRERAACVVCKAFAVPVHALQKVVSGIASRHEARKMTRSRCRGG